MCDQTVIKYPFQIKCGKICGTEGAAKVLKSKTQL